MTLLEQGPPSGESSWAGGGILSPLLPWQYATPVIDMALSAMRNYGAWIADIEAHAQQTAEYRVCGMQVFDPADDPQALLGWCRHAGLNATLLKSAAGEGVWLPDIAQVRNPRLSAALHAAILHSGGVLRTYCSIQAFRSTAGQIEQVETNHGVFDVDQILIATGAWSGLPLAGLDAVPNIRPIRGQMLLFKLDPGLLDRILYRQGLYIIPRLDGHILVGSTLEDAGFDKSRDLATAQRLHAEAARLFPILAQHRPIQHWAGLRPGSPDNIPVIGRHPDFDNVFVNVGHYRYGVTMAPAAAELLADLMEGKTSALDPTPYSWAAAQQRQWGDQL